MLQILAFEISHVACICVKNLAFSTPDASALIN